MLMLILLLCFSVLRFYEVIEYCKNNPGIRSAGWLMIERLIIKSK